MRQFNYKPKQLIPPSLVKNITLRVRGPVAKVVLAGISIMMAGTGNTMNAQQIAVSEIVITELYPDPGGSSQLPLYEFAELKNRSGRTLNLRGLRLTDGTSVASINTDVELKTDSFIILCSQSAALSFRPFGHTLGLTGFPTLNNDGDQISLTDENGLVIHSIAYTKSWYRNDSKKEGGFTLEMVDPGNRCGAELNWRASDDPSGGTPGRTNSVNALFVDDVLPALQRVYIKDPNTIVAVFDEPLDSLSAATISCYKPAEVNLAIVSARPSGPAFREVELTISTPLEAHKIYRISINDVTDCSGNPIGSINTAMFGIPANPAKDDVVINELLFNPQPAGFDYLEIYNRGRSVIDAGRLLVAGKNVTGGFVNQAAVAEPGRLLFPGEYLVLTENKAWLEQQFVLREASKTVSVVKTLPSMPDDKGYIALTDNQGMVIDELSYSEKWHFALLNSREGVSLERIDFSQPSGLAGNWMSAASSAGFGTPGYQNSQFRADLQVAGDFSISPLLFSPDNDGVNDVSGVRYEMPEAGYMGSVTIYDVAGRPVRYLLKSGLLGMKGVVNWDGLDERSQRLPVGSYVVMMEVFNLKGKVKRMKKVVVLGRRLR